MTIQAHLSELERRHQALEDELAEAMNHPSSDDLKIAELKRRKLLVKDEMTRLAREMKFEEAAKLRDRIGAVERTLVRQRVVRAVALLEALQVALERVVRARRLALLHLVELLLELGHAADRLAAPPLGHALVVTAE